MAHTFFIIFISMIDQNISEFLAVFYGPLFLLLLYKINYIEFMMDQYILIISFLAIALFSGCKDAPRDNPMDPSSPEYVSTTSVTGHIYLLDINSGLAQAKIYSIQNGISVVSDGNGYFSFPYLSVGPQTLVFSKENFISDTQRVVLQSRTSTDVTFYVNGAPSVLSQNILTRKIDQYYPSPQYFVDITASVSDPNGIMDVDSVWFAVDTLLYPMGYSVSTKQFQTTLYKYDLPTNTIQWLVNKPLKIRSKDRRNAVNLSSSFYVSRIIENTAIPIYPTTNPLTQKQDTTGLTPVFQWTPPDVTFNYTYTLLLSRVESEIQTVVWTYSQLNSSDGQIQYPGTNGNDSLSAGEYVWTISVVDDFGNYSSSKEASFIVR
jgi:hypothetical protein